jgi:hypothetical protein
MNASVRLGTKVAGNCGHIFAHFIAKILFYAVGKCGGKNKSVFWRI